MPFAWRRRSLNSVIIKSIERKRVESEVAKYVSDLCAHHPEIVRVIWFGSWVTGLPSPGSDVDLCLILSSSNRRPRDRASEYLPVGFPVGIDLLVYTQEEFDQLPQRSPGLYEAITSGNDIGK